MACSRFGSRELGIANWNTQSLGGDDTNDHEDQPVTRKRLLVSRILQRIRDRKCREDRAHAVAGSDDPGGKAAAIRKPLDHMTDHADIYDACADATEEAIGEIQFQKCRRTCSEQPAQSGQRAAQRQQCPRAELVDQ